MFWAYLWGIETRTVQAEDVAESSFEPTYEELKPGDITWKWLLGELFWAYLWGIETAMPPVSTAGPLNVLSLPMRNWNRRLRSRKSSSSTVLSLPMRNWNTVPRRDDWRRAGVLSLPMRNWNQNRSTATTSRKRGFEPTYEELKPVRLRDGPECDKSFEPTYEELKPKARSYPSSFSWGFEPTYEELKQPYSRKGWGGNTPFWAYLWGIETFAPLRRQQANRACFEPTYEELKPAPPSNPTDGQLVLSLPMRNWNFTWPGQMMNGPKGFEPTYEELKLFLCFSVARGGISFEPTYEELKLSFTLINSIFFSSFEPTYEELKRQKPGLFLRKEWWVLSLPMRNWNIDADFTVVEEDIPFWAYLWGIETVLPL